MNILPIERQSQILSRLVEGNSVRSTSRMSGAHIVTILSLSGASATAANG